MAKLLESQIRRDPNFEVPVERHLGLVVFCLKVCNTNLSGSFITVSQNNDLLSNVSFTG